MSTHRTRVIAAWSVHALTLSGVIWATLAMLAVFDDRPKAMWVFLGIALVVDGVDGTLARRAEVRTYAPHFDGVILDCVVDYLTWTFIPALFMYRAGLLGDGVLGIVLLLVINVTSMFCYANTKMKTDDFYFMGFPAAWNVVALAFWLFTPSVPVVAVLVVVFSTLTWAPITFVHPFRVARFMVVNLAATAAWVATSAVLVAAAPVIHPVAVWIWVVSGSWLILLGLVRTAARMRGQRLGSSASAGAADTER